MFAVSKRLRFKTIAAVYGLFVAGTLSGTVTSFAAFGSPAPAEKIASAAFKATPVFKASDIIWGFDFISDSEIILALKSGELLLVDAKTGKSQAVAGGPTVVARGQGGLLDVKVYRESGKTWIYLTASVTPDKGTASEKKSNQTTALFRGEWKSPKIENITRIFEAEPSVDSSLHFGSRLAFPKSGGVFMTLGERNQRDRAQDLSQHWGKVVRLTLEGKPHPQNPYTQKSSVGNVTPKPEIYSWGHRNPQGIAIDPGTGDVYVSEHGPRGGDEVNLIKASANYGWPTITYGREYWGPRIGKNSQPGLEQPVKYYVPSIAPSSLLIPSGKAPKELAGKFIQGALVLQHVNITDIKSGNETRLFEDMKKRFRHVAESPSGEIFLATDDGDLLKLERQ